MRARDVMADVAVEFLVRWPVISLVAWWCLR